MKKNYFKNLKGVFIIGEISANHGGSIQRAFKLIDLAKRSKFNIVKFQTYQPECMTINSSRKDFMITRGLWKGYSLWNLYSKAQTPFSWHQKLVDHCKKKNIDFFSSPFSKNGVDLLEKLDCPMYKVASFELTDIDLIKYISKKNKPIILSTGMSSYKEIDCAVNTIKKYNNNELVLLYCVSNYPSDIKDFQLSEIYELKKRYGCEIGLSDHSNDIDVAKIAVTFGVKVIEKHIALKGQRTGFDLKFSIKGNQLSIFKNEVDKVYSMINLKKINKRSDDKSKIHRRSIYCSKDIKKGELFSKENIKIVRPSFGLNPEYYSKLIGKNMIKNIKFGMPLSRNHFK